MIGSSMKVNKVIHVIITCEKCHKDVTQYLNEDPVFEVIKVNNKALDVCIPCADKHYENEHHGV
jgi:TusA-related sulfurtransferase